MLSTKAHARSLITGNDDVIDEAWQRRDAANEEGGNGAPVAGKLGVVAVDAMEVVHVGHRDVATANNVIAMTQAR